MNFDAVNTTDWCAPPAISSAASFAQMAAQAASRQSQDRRRRPRYLLSKAAIAIPVLDNFAPNSPLQGEALTYDISSEGISFETRAFRCDVNELILLGVEADDGDVHFATVEVQHVDRLPGTLRVGGNFAAASRDVLRPDNLMPAYRPDDGDYRTGLPSETLHKWVDLGIFQPMMVDRVYVCPECDSLPSVRNGCRSCGSIHIATHQLMHHFSCSYVGKASEFHHAGQFRCPRCQVHGLVVGETIEQLSGPCHCLDCKWSDTGTDVFGQCIACQHRFRLAEAAQRELIGYHVNRLDPSALLDM
jgi:hypothetical protein